MEQITIFIGIFGVVINLIAYGLLSSGRIRADEARYQVVNIVGTSCILLSFISQFNLASFIMNVAWLLIGIVGLVRIHRTRSI